MHISSKWSISVRFPHQNSVCFSPLAHTCHMSNPSHPPMKRLSQCSSVDDKNQLQPISNKDKKLQISNGRTNHSGPNGGKHSLNPTSPSPLHERNFDLLVSFTKITVASALTWLCPDMNIIFFTVSASIPTTFLATNIAAVSFFVLTCL
jgi:hypothetical protein